MNGEKSRYCGCLRGEVIVVLGGLKDFMKKEVFLGVEGFG